MLFVLTMGDDYDNAPLDNVQGIFDSEEKAKARAESLLAQDVIAGYFRHPPVTHWWQRHTNAWLLNDEHDQQAFACVEGFEVT